MLGRAVCRTTALDRVLPRGFSSSRASRKVGLKSRLKRRARFPSQLGVRQLAFATGERCARKEDVRDLHHGIDVERRIVDGDGPGRATSTYLRKYR